MATENGENGEEEEPPSVSDRISALRNRLSRREKKIRADRQARERRIEREEPEGKREAAEVKFRGVKDEAEMSAEEARGLAEDAKELVATELGVSPDDAEDVIEQSSSLLSEFGNQLGALDADGDGDTDMLTALDQPLTGAGGDRGSRSGRGRRGGTDAPAEAVGGGTDIDADLGSAEAVGGGPAFDPSSTKLDLSEDRT